jgi:DNA-binding IscR family transcriptional regulator
MEQDRRDKTRRAQIVRCVLESIVQNPSLMVSVTTLQQWLHVPGDAAERILQRLVDSGLMREVRGGVWVRGTIPGAQREWC